MYQFYKKYLFLALTVLISFNSCNIKSKEKDVVIGFSQFTTQDNWRKAMIHSMKIETQLHKNLELLVLDGEGNVDNQIADIEELINQQVDVLIVSPIAPKPLKAIINKAINANIPVIILHREIKDVNYHSFIGADNYKIGENAAKYIASLKDKSNIIEIKGWAGTTPTLQKSSGFKNIIQNNSNLNIVGTTQERYEEVGIKKYFKEQLLNNKDVNVVFAHKDILAFEAYEVAKSLDLDANIKFIGVGGVNAEKGGLNLIEKDILKASILQPTGGKEAIQTAVAIIKNQEIKKQYLLPSLVIDKSNVSVIKRQATLISSQEIDIEKQQHKIKDQYQLYTSQRVFLICTLIFLALIGLLLFFTLLTKRKLHKQNKLLEAYLEQIASQKNALETTTKELEDLNKTTNNFFTGVSHDFKTPTSLILSSTESLITETKTTKPKELSLIYNNSKRLLRMINQLLDFKRLENKKIRLQAAKTDLVQFTQNIFNDFEKEASKRDINFSYIKNVTTAIVYIDHNLFDNILFNLLSNAFKFTTNKGEIILSIDETEDRIYITIKDSGIGIPKKETTKIFKQFFQGSNNKQASSGIGLYLTKEYLKQHHGDIEVISDIGKGAIFKLYIPKGKNHFTNDTIIINDNLTFNDKDIIDIDSFSFDQEPLTMITDEEKDTLLIIEDNTDLRTFLKEKLSKKYNIEESDGINAIEKAISIVPDIIISDVNLPEKNGFEITKILKEDERTSHIPILILTALSSDEAHLKGLKNNVDMFLTKPFNLSILHQSLKTLSYNRKKLQQFYKQNLPSVVINKKETPKKTEKKKDLEREFLSNVTTLVTKNIDNSEFTVEILADYLHMSRVQLYRKTKAVLGISISDYIQNIKLEKSKELLLDTSLTISDVAYSTGFSSPNYFSTSFKNKYGKTPNQFKKQELSRKKK